MTRNAGSTQVKLGNFQKNKKILALRSMAESQTQEQQQESQGKWITRT